MNSIEEKFDILHELSTVLISGYDPANIAGQVRTLLKDLVICDTVLIFINDRENNLLSAANIYNNLVSQFNNISISYDNPVALDILIHKKNRIRIKPDKPTLPSMSSELFVPLKSPKQVLGCLFVARERDIEFTTFDIKLLEMAAFYIAIFLERTQWEKHFYNIYNLKQKNKAITKSFIESLQNPAVILDIFKDKILEINQMLAEQLNYPKGDLLKLNFSTICKDYFSLKNIEPGLNQSFLIKFVSSSGKLIQYKTLYTYIDNLDNGVLLLILLPEKEPERDLQKNFWLHELFAALSNVTLQDIQNDLKNAAHLILNMFDAKYLTLTRVTNTESLSVMAAYDCQNDSPENMDENLQKSLNLNYFLSIAETKKPLYLPVITDSPDYDKLKKLSALNIQSLACIPLMVNNHCLGLLNIFCQHPCNWQQKDIIKLSSIARITSYFVFSPLLKDEIDELFTKQMLIENLIKLFNSVKPFTTKIGIAAEKLSNFMKFDYFSLTLFDENGNIDQSIDMTHPGLIDKFEIRLERKNIPECSLIQVFQLIKDIDKKKGDQTHPSRLPFALPLHSSVVLVSGDRYLGNFAIGRIKKQPFSRSEIDFLKQIGSMFSHEVLKYQTLENIQKYQKNSFVFENLNINIFEKPDKNDLLEKIRETTQNVLEANHCKAAFINENMKMLDLFDWIPDTFHNFLSVTKIKNLLIEQKKTHLPILINSVDTFKEKFCTQKVNSLEFFVPFIISPVFKNKQLYVLILATWEKNYTCGVDDIHIMQLMTKQAENLFSQIELYSGSLEKIKSLENYVNLVTHELKTPLQTVQTFASIIKEDISSNLSDESLKYLDRLLVNLDNMENMVMDLLELSRLDKIQNKFTVFESREALNEALQKLEGIIESNHVNLQISENLPSIYANETGIIHVFSNLISNAVKYSKKTETPVITIDAMETPTTWEFSIKDNGTGIASEEKEKIFELFYKNNENSRFLSTGVGLAIVKKIIQNHNGEIWVESTPGMGSDFKFTLPKQNIKFE
ncbi:GAF domain-containing protein [candidate division KSB1 bacterium]|nr:GAF domain-containing protein [candidate division KSB1 bacterium]